MNVSVIAHPNAKHERLEIREGKYHVYVTQPPVDNKATEAVRKLLAGHFKVSKQAVMLKRGEKSKIKQFYLAI